jgi:hypothetical protein
MVHLTMANVDLFCYMRIEWISSRVCWSSFISSEVQEVRITPIGLGLLKSVVLPWECFYLLTQKKTVQVVAVQNFPRRANYTDITVLK